MQKNGLKILSNCRFCFNIFALKDNDFAFLTSLLSNADKCFFMNSILNSMDYFGECSRRNGVTMAMPTVTSLVSYLIKSNSFRITSY